MIFFAIHWSRETFFRGIWSQCFGFFFFLNSTVVTFRQMSRPFSLYSGIGTRFLGGFFVFVSSRAGKFFSKKSRPPPAY